MIKGLRLLMGWGIRESRIMNKIPLDRILKLMTV